jgi:aerobic carbon-monoxide dehydrogenase medium subunit
VLVDVNRVPGLAELEVRDGVLHAGALVRHTALAAQGAHPLAAEAAGWVGHTAIRSRGTLGGSLAHADPAADYPAVMLALDAEIHAKGPKGWRVVKAQDFFQGLFTVDLAADEILVGVQFRPVVSAAYAKLHQRASHFAIVGVAAALEVKNGSIQSARIGLTGAASHATRLTDVEQALEGRPASADTIAAGARLAGAKVADLNSDIHASAEYRRAMVEVFTRRALTRALARVR